MPEIIGEYADRLMTVEMRNRAMNHNMIRGLYDAARARHGGTPLTTLAADGLLSRIGQGDVVFLVAGAGYPPEMPHGENDGPPGIAVLARLIYWGLKAVPVFVAEAGHMPPIIASSEAAAVMVRDFELAKNRRLGAAALTTPDRSDALPRWADEVFDTYKPKAIIAAERLGPNEKGVTHYSTGVTHPGTLNIGPLFDAAAAYGAFSVGVGDNGNEVGFGVIHDVLQDVHPYGRHCPCGCGGGVPTTVKTDVLIPAGISNWGCYALATVLAFMAKTPDAFHDPAMEERILRACLEAGGVEARYCTKRFILDGVEGESSMAIVQLFRDMLRLNLAAPDRGPAH